MITSPSNPLVKELVRLRSRRHRDRSQQFVIEGVRPLAIAAGAGVEILQQVVCPELGGRATFQDVPVVEMSAGPFRKASQRQGPDGVMGVARHLDTRLEALPSSPSLVLLVEAIEKPGNLGAMLRTADAAGADAVVVTDPATDVHNPNVIRASQGALFTVPLAVSHRDGTLEWLRSNRVRLVTTSPNAGRAPWEIDLTVPVAIAVGAEAVGLSPELIDASEEELRIPMSGTVDSLNASVSAAVVLYEARRQRAQI